MKDTIKAKNGAFRLLACGKNCCEIYDVQEFVLKAKNRSYADYVDEVVNGDNECAVKVGVFTDTYGNQYIYWYDEETLENFITEVSRNDG